MYGSTQIETAWTIIPILIVLVLYLAAARNIHAVEDAPDPVTALDVVAIVPQLIGVSLSEARDRHRKRAYYSGKGSQRSDANVPAIAFGRYDRSFLGAGAYWQDRPRTESS